MSILTNSITQSIINQTLFRCGEATPRLALDLQYRPFPAGRFIVGFKRVYDTTGDFRRLRSPHTFFEAIIWIPSNDHTDVRAIYKEWQEGDAKRIIIRRFYHFGMSIERNEALTDDIFSWLSGQGLVDRPVGLEVK